MHCRLPLVTAFIGAIILFIAIGCGDDDDSPSSPSTDPLIGTWEMTSNTIDGVEQNVELTLVFKENGEGTVTIEDTTMPFTWTKDGNQLIVEFGGNSFTLDYSVTSSTLTIEYDDETGHNVETYARQ